MRNRIILLAAIAASSVLFLAATPNPASAANCTNPVFNNTYYASGLWHFATQVQACTDVDQIAVSRTNANSLYYGSGWVNQTNFGVWPAPAAYNPDYQYFGRIGIPLANSPVVTWNIPPFCSYYGYAPGTTFVNTRYFSWRIHGISTGTWGPYHQTIANEVIGC